MNDTTQDNSEIENEYARLQTRAFSIMLEIIAIFGIPAGLAVVIGKALSDEKTLTYILLAVTFVLSWVILAWRIRVINRKLKAMRDRIKKGDK